jgi:hypothetical protein
LIVPILLAFAGTVSASTILTVSGTGGAIPDATGSGMATTPGTTSFSIVVSDPNTILGSGQNVTVDLMNLVHPWAGNLEITLQHVGYGLPVSVVTRVGSTNNGANGRAGDGSDYNGNYSFNSDFTGNLWAAAASANDSQTIPGGDYFATSARYGTETPFSDIWNGQPVAGTWILSITDHHPGDAGSLGSWDLRFLTGGSVPPGPDPVETPEPATTAMLATGMIGLLLFGRKAVSRKG